MSADRYAREEEPAHGHFLLLHVGATQYLVEVDVLANNRPCSLADETQRGSDG